MKGFIEINTQRESGEYLPELVNVNRIVSISTDGENTIVTIDFAIERKKAAQNLIWTCKESYDEVVKKIENAMM